MIKTQEIRDELKPVVKTLQAEGIDVYTYTCQSKQGEPISSLYWWDGRRVLNIQPEYFGGYNLGVSYVPSHENGSGCRLSGNDGRDADFILRYRNEPTWVRSAVNYKSMDDFLKQERVLTFYKIETIRE